MRKIDRLRENGKKGMNRDVEAEQSVQLQTQPNKVTSDGQ